MKKIKQKREIIIGMILFFLIIIPSIKAMPILDLNVAISAENVSVDYLVYDGGEFNYTYSNSGNYEILIYDNQNELIFNNYYSLGKPMDADEQLITIRNIYDKIPYRKNMALLEVKNNNTLIKSVDLVFCNNNSICDENENTLTCSDCKKDKIDNLCINSEDGICDPDCLEGYDPDCNKTQENNIPLDLSKTESTGINWINILFVLLVIVAVILAAWVLFYAKKKNK